LLALVPYIVFRMRGYSREQLNLRSANWKNDTLVILVVLAIGCMMDLTGPNIFQLTPHQRVVGGAAFVCHSPVSHRFAGHDLDLRHPVAALCPCVFAGDCLPARRSQLSGNPHL
jgi:hypothetical protein